MFGAEVINIWLFLLSIISAGLGYWLKGLQDNDKLLADKVNRIEVLVAGDYVRRDRFEQDMRRIFEKLEALDTKFSDRQELILSKLDGKQDRKE